MEPLSLAVNRKLVADAVHEEARHEEAGHEEARHEEAGHGGVGRRAARRGGRWSAAAEGKWWCVVIWGHGTVRG